MKFWNSKVFGALAGVMALTVGGCATQPSHTREDQGRFSQQDLSGGGVAPAARTPITRASWVRQ